MSAGRLNRRRVLLVSAGFAAALGVSALLYQRSSSANFDAHAQVVESIGRVRERTELVSKQTLAATPAQARAEVASSATARSQERSARSRSPGPRRW